MDHAKRIRTHVCAAAAACALLSCQGEVGGDNLSHPNADAPGIDPSGLGDQRPETAGDPRSSGAPSDPSAKPAGGDGEPGAASDCAADGGGAAPLRRLTDTQYRNAVEAIFDGVLHASIGLPASQPNLGRTGFTAEPEATAVSARGAEQIAAAAEELAVQAVERLDALLPCYPAAADRACAEQFVTTYGTRAFRRPLEDAERALLLDLFEREADTLPFAERIGAVLAALLQMPQFLYVVERGEPVAGRPDVVKLTGYEVATRLALLYWDSTPDQELLDAASAGELGEPAGVEAHARRLIEHPRARPALRRFFREWLQVVEATELEKDPMLYPEFDVELARSFSEELDRFLDEIATDPEATPATLLSSARGFANARLAAFYGLPSDGSDPHAFFPVDLAEADRAGLLQRPALLAGLAYPGDSSPIHRGKFVLTRLLCVDVPPPPADAFARQPEAEPGSSQRDRSLARRAITECAGCHDLMDTIGFGFEEFDGIGQRRTHYPDGTPVDRRGEVRAEVDVQGAFEGTAELAALLQDSADVRTCVARQWLRYAWSRMDGPEDACTLGELQDAFAGAGFTLRELFVAAARTSAFRFRRMEVE